MRVDAPAQFFSLTIVNKILRTKPARTSYLGDNSRRIVRTIPDRVIGEIFLSRSNVPVSHLLEQRREQRHEVPHSRMLINNLPSYFFLSVSKRIPNITDKWKVFVEKQTS